MTDGASGWSRPIGIAATHPENGWVTRTAPLQIVLSDVSYCRADLNPGDLPLALAY